MHKKWTVKKKNNVTNIVFHKKYLYNWGKRKSWHTKKYIKNLVQKMPDMVGETGGDGDVAIYIRE
jgi:hypothetical protein